MKTILIYYGTKEGQTAKISEYIARVFSDAGYAVHLIRASDAAWDLESRQYAGAILGASVHSSRFSNEFRQGVLAHRDELAKIPSAFFSVCLGILERENPRAQAAEKQIVYDFLAEAGLSPALVEVFPGAIKHSAYGWLKRKVLRRVARRAGADIEDGEDREYTDWERVREFARAFVSELARPSPAIREFPADFSATSAPHSAIVRKETANPIVSSVADSAPVPPLSAIVPVDPRADS